jgi:hypothetical protein
MKVQVTIQGVTPLLMNRFQEANEVKVQSGISAVSISGKGTPREQAALKAYSDDKGNLYIPGPNIFSCIIQAGTFHKCGKSKITTLKSSLIPAGMSIMDLVCPLDTMEFEVDSRSVVIPSTGGRIMAHRPRLDEWSLTFTLDVDTTMFDLKTARLLIDDAGKKVGLGDFRPARKGPFGKFVVVKWEEQ